MMKIPFNDLGRSHHKIREELNNAFLDVIKRSRFILDEETIKFESNFAAYLGIKHCIGCGNATDALEIILRALGVGSGDEAIVPANTYLATAEAVVNAGATPRFVDINPDTRHFSVSDFEKNISENTKAIMVVHLYGWPVDMAPILQIAKRNGLFVVEDCAQAHGATYHGMKVGSIGDAAAFSFYPTKNLGALGDGGAVVTQNDDLAAKCRMMANHGQAGREDYRISGRNSRLDELQAAFLNVKLQYLDLWNGERKTLVIRYLNNLKDSGIGLPVIPDYGEPVYHLMVATVPERDRMQLELSKKGIQTMVHYKNILPDLKPFKEYECHIPVARQLAERLISLPLFPVMKGEEVDYVCDAVLEAMKKINI